MKDIRKIGFAKLIPVDEALDKLFSHIYTVEAEEVNIKDALNRISAEDIKSKFDLPPFDRAAMDGYAIKAEDSFGASPKNPKKVKLIGTIDIGGSTNIYIQNGEAVRISTGTAIPDGCTAVIKIEDTEIDGEEITLYTALTPGKNISFKGEDVKVNTTIINKGTDLKAEHIALLCALGHVKIKVKTKPKVSVFATGDELIEIGNNLEKNKIYNSNSPMITSLVKIYGGDVVKEGTLKDDENVIESNLLNAVKESDIIIFTGGTSVGTKDLLPNIIKKNGKIIAHGLAMRPGTPILIGMVNDKVVFCLPGTPVAAYVGFLKIVGPTIRKMMECIEVDPRMRTLAKISKNVPTSGLGYLSYLRVKLEYKSDEIIAHPVKLKGSGIISSITEADGIIEIPPYQEGLTKGDLVIVKYFPK
ncbi:MAG: gephyrin-like molybdotransferase Glp [Promethearchaeia archaeon]